MFGVAAVKYTKDQIRRIEEANQIREAAEPLELANLVSASRLITFFLWSGLMAL